jgi:hypothetical protein
LLILVPLWGAILFQRTLIERKDVVWPMVYAGGYVVLFVPYTLFVDQLYPYLNFKNLASYAALFVGVLMVYGFFRLACKLSEDKRKKIAVIQANKQ